MTRFSISAVFAVGSKFFHHNDDLPVLEIVLTLLVKGLIRRGNVDPKAPVKQVTADNLKYFSIISAPLTQPADKTHDILGIFSGDSTNLVHIKGLLESSTTSTYFHNVKELIC